MRLNTDRHFPSSEARIDVPQSWRRFGNINRFRRPDTRATACPSRRPSPTCNTPSSTQPTLSTSGFQGYINNALNKLYAGQPVSSILVETTALIGMFQGESRVPAAGIDAGILNGLPWL